MSKADEMFEELGYKKSLHTDIKEEVWGEYFTNENKYVEIHFDYIDKEVCTYAILGDSGVYIQMQELQAINQKCEELGWLDDN